MSNNTPGVAASNSEGNASASHEKPPPDGGTGAWLQILGSFFLVFNTWGIINAFGAYQTYYASGKLFLASSSAIAWIGSLETFILLATGLFSGPIFDRGGLRFLLTTGSFLIIFGHMMLSFCKRYWHVVLAQGVLIGLGTGCLFVPCVAILPQYFRSRLGLASGLAIGGSSIGGIVYPIVLHRLIDAVGFPWAVRTIGFIALVTLAVPISVLRMRTKPSKARSLVDWHAFHDVDYLLLVAAGFLAYMGLFVLLFYLSFYASNTGLTTESVAFYLVAIFNGGSWVGRTVPNAVADRTGPFDLLSIGAILVGMLDFCMIAANNQSGILALAVISGTLSGVLIGLLPLCFIALIQDKSLLGTRMGMGFAVFGFGVLCGGPTAGGILGKEDPLNWQGTWLFAGSVTCASGLCFMVLRIKVYGWSSLMRS